MIFGKTAFLGVAYIALVAGSESEPKVGGKHTISTEGKHSPQGGGSRSARMDGFNKDVFKNSKRPEKSGLRLVDEVEMDAHSRGIRTDPHEWRECREKRKVSKESSRKLRISTSPPQAKKLSRSTDGAIKTKKHGKVDRDSDEMKGIEGEKDGKS